MKTTIGFIGDTAFSEFTKNLYKDSNNIDKKIYKFLNTNDYNIINFESPITESIITSKAALAHKSSPESISFIKNNIKNTVFSLANNHMMDFGRKGLIDTLNYLDKEKIPYIGAGHNIDEAVNYIILGNKIKVGIVSFQYKDTVIAGKTTAGTAHDKHTKSIKQKIKDLKNKVNWIVVIYHGGEEFINTPMPYTRRKYKKILSWGADIIVAHHPHTVQGYEKIKDKMIFYSIGNFIFDTEFQRAQKGTDEGILLNIKFGKDKYTYDYLPIKNTRTKENIKSVNKNIHFNDIKTNYRKNWKKEAIRFEEIRTKKKELKKYRNHYSINNLYIEKAHCTNIVSFDKLIENNYISELELPSVFKNKNIFKRIIERIKRKLESINIKKIIYFLYAKIF